MDQKSSVVRSQFQKWWHRHNHARPKIEAIQSYALYCPQKDICICTNKTPFLWINSTVHMVWFMFSAEGSFNHVLKKLIIQYPIVGGSCAEGYFPASFINVYGSGIGLWA